MSVDLSGVLSVYVHPGQAHRDDVLACAVALAFIDGPVRIFREDCSDFRHIMDSSDCLVLDVGMVHRPSSLCFDHHQFDRDHEPACALSLLVDALGLTEEFESLEWWRPTLVLDSKGPFALAAELPELKAFPFGMMSPIEDRLLKRFGAGDEVDEGLVRLLKMLGEDLVQWAKENHEGLSAMRDQMEVHDLNGVEALCWKDEADADLTGQIQRIYHPDAGVLVAPDDRGDGWTLYRFNDHARVDFSVLDVLEDIVFSHPIGFIAKTKEMSFETAVALARSAVK